MSEAMGPAALITGASTGIGREFARFCARDGFDLILVARSQATLESLAAEIRTQTNRRVLVIAKDLADPAAPEQLFAEVERSGYPVELLINNAGFGLGGLFHQLDDAQQMDMIQLNIGALTHLTRLFLPGFLASRRGGILNVASTAAFQPGPWMAVYAATKAYVLSFSAALSNEMRGTGVTVTCLCPGATRTEFDKRAGMSNTRLFQARSVMDAATVARLGLLALKRRKPVAVAGRLNAAMAFSTRFVPRQWAAAIARRLQQSR